MKKIDNEPVPFFKLTKKQFEKREFKDKEGKPVQIGTALINDYGSEFKIVCSVDDEVTMTNKDEWREFNLDSIQRLRRSI